MTEQKAEQNIGRNEPCPCGSGKKYKRCCGVTAAPKLTVPRTVMPMEGAAQGGPGAPGGLTPDMLNQMDPNMMMQMSQALQRLPRGQMQRLQALVQKAMSGKDVSRESAEFEKTLPLELQEMMRGFTAQAAALGGGAPEGAPGAAFPTIEAEAGVPQMSEEEARELVAKAAAEGKISADKAEELLGGSPATATPGAGASEASGPESRFGRIFKGLQKKK